MVKQKSRLCNSLNNSTKLINVNSRSTIVAKGGETYLDVASFEETRSGSSSKSGVVRSDMYKTKDGMSTGDAMRVAKASGWTMESWAKKQSI